MRSAVVQAGDVDVQARAAVADAPSAEAFHSANGSWGSSDNIDHHAVPQFVTEPT
jgi:hypothetical protein